MALVEGWKVRQRFNNIDLESSTSSHYKSYLKLIYIDVHSSLKKVSVQHVVLKQQFAYQSLRLETCYDHMHKNLLKVSEWVSERKPASGEIILENVQSSNISWQRVG